MGIPSTSSSRRMLSLARSAGISQQTTTPRQDSNTSTPYRRGIWVAWLLHRSRLSWSLNILKGTFQMSKSLGHRRLLSPWRWLRHRLCRLLPWNRRLSPLTTMRSLHLHHPRMPNWLRLGTSWDRLKCPAWDPFFTTAKRPASLAHSSILEDARMVSTVSSVISVDLEKSSAATSRRRHKRRRQRG